MNRDAGEVVALHSQVRQIPVWMLLLVRLPPRNQLCLMEFLIVCPEFERRLQRKLPEKLRPASDRWRHGSDVAFEILLKPPDEKKSVKVVVFTTLEIGLC